MLQTQLDQLRDKCDRPSDVASELDAAIGLMKRLGVVADSNGDHSAARELVDLVDARLFLRFSPKPWGKRTVYQATGGVITFGASAPPIKVYEGRTGRVALQSNLKQEIAPSHRESTGSKADEKEISLGNASRGDRI